MQFTYIGNQSKKDVRLAGSFANGAFVTANSAASFANGAFITANSAAAFANAAFLKANTSSGITYTASNTAPSNPKIGDQWYIIALDVLYEYINDGTSNNWVDIISPTITSNSVNVTSGTTTETVSPFLLMGA